VHHRDAGGVDRPEVAEVEGEAAAAARLEAMEDGLEERH
jgi:hypothetical protein